jgi:hypothetical protein
MSKSDPQSRAELKGDSTVQRKDDPEALSETDAAQDAAGPETTSDTVDADTDPWRTDADTDDSATDAATDDGTTIEEAVTVENDTDRGADDGILSGDRDTAAAEGETRADTENWEAVPEAGTDMAAEAAAETMAAPAQESPAPAPVSRRERRRRGGFVPLFLGGLVAAGLGFAAAHSERLQDFIPLPGAADTEELVARVDSIADTARANAAALAAVPSAADVAAAQAAAADAGAAAAALRSDLDALSAQVETLVGSGAGDGSAAVDALRTRVAALEAQAQSLFAGDGSSASAAAVTAFRQQTEEAIAAYAESLEQAAAEAEARVAATQDALSGLEASAATAARDLAAARLLTLAATGAPFAEALADLAEAGGAPPPEALTAVAADGMATVSDLERAWPEAARAALQAALRAGLGPDADVGDRVAAFLRNHLGARSVEPREGDSADAVLSRTGAAVDAGDIDGALTELAALNADAREAGAMASWIAAAQARQAALAALAAYGGDAAAQ